MEIFKDIEQGSDEWFKLRLGLLTASNFSKFLGKKDKSERKTYRYKLAGEILSHTIEASYTNANMERGNEIEDMARARYQLSEKYVVDQVAFIKMNDHIGCSPDGLIGDCGMVEIKCPLASTHVKRIDEDRLPPEYKAQVQGQMWVAEKLWCDFVSFHPDVPQSLFIKRVERDDEYIKEIKDASEEFLVELKQLVEKCGG